MADTTKDNIIKKVYYSDDIGFGSIASTYREAHKQNPGITLENVKEWMNKQKHKQTKFKYSGENSYVANHVLQQIEIDLIDMTSKASDNNGYRYAVVGIDIFSKYGWAMPIKTKQPQDVLAGLKDILNNIGIPEILYSDSEGSFNSTEFVKFINSKNIKHIFTNSHAHFVEAFNKTIKQQTYARLEAKGEDLDKWTLELFNVIKKYNKTPHRTTTLTPEEARMDKNRLTVFMNIALKAKRNRMYPPIALDSSVRVLLKPSTFKKSWHDKWSPMIHKVIGVQGRYYLVDDNKRKLYLRHELLLAD
jgi:hypothetical protein